TGKVNLFCFDKTGTLTAEGMEVLGIRPLSTASQYTNAAAASIRGSLVGVAAPVAHQGVALMNMMQTITKLPPVVCPVADLLRCCLPKLRMLAGVARTVGVPHSRQPASR